MFRRHEGSVRMLSFNANQMSPRWMRVPHTRCTPYYRQYAPDS